MHTYIGFAVDIFMFMQVLPLIKKKKARQMD